MNKKSFSLLPTQPLAVPMRAGLPLANKVTSIKSSSEFLHDSTPEAETLKEEVTRIIYKSVHFTNQLRAQS